VFLEHMWSGDSDSGTGGKQFHVFERLSLWSSVFPCATAVSLPCSASRQATREGYSRAQLCCLKAALSPAHCSGVL
uniref:Uncharacterized protein n=1 Tax=Esox lucius TaxID=8010 RepID=A0AAY5JY88_ESOLU